MTSEEFNNEFDILYNNIASNQAPGLDLYEKSVFLTKAQDDIIRSYFNPKSNKVNEGFDGNEKRQVDFSMITETKVYTTFSNAILDARPNSKRVNFPTSDRIMIIINEFADVDREGHSVRLTVVPIIYKEYSRMMSRPYKRPLKYQAWRLLESSNNQKSAELIIGPDDVLTRYAVRYLRRPKAIILKNLAEEGVSIDGQTAKQDCELDPILHREILQRAVELAKAAYTGGLQEQVVLGTASQTNIGMSNSN